MGKVAREVRAAAVVLLAAAVVRRTLLVLDQSPELCRRRRQGQGALWTSTVAGMASGIGSWDGLSLRRSGAARIMGKAATTVRVAVVVWQTPAAARKPVVHMV